MPAISAALYDARPIAATSSSENSAAADGFDQYFGIPDAATGRPWAVKQGWACCKPDRVPHSTGLLGKNHRYIVVALSSHDDGTSWEQLTEAVRSAVSARAMSRHPLSEASAG